jgi:hypothetical protein
VFGSGISKTGVLAAGFGALKLVFEGDVQNLTDMG